MLGGLGAAKSPESTEAQAQEIVAAQQVAARDPHAPRWSLHTRCGSASPTIADGTKQGGLRSMKAGESRIQPRIAPVLDAALPAAGVRRG